MRLIILLLLLVGALCFPKLTVVPINIESPHMQLSEPLKEKVESTLDSVLNKFGTGKPGSCNVVLTTNKKGNFL